MKTEQQIIVPPTKTRKDENRKMNALVYRGKKSVVLEEVPMPMITDPTDAIVKITASTICGSDLHLYNGELPNKYLQGLILGHEAIGIVQDVGQYVKNIQRGDRVVISAVISCGMCEYCKRGEMSCCDMTNASKDQLEMYGHNTGALFGYSELFGGIDGLQAEYARVPFADVNLFKIPETVDDKQALLISDVACTGFHGNELADVKEGDRVVIFGCGPVGLMAQMWAKYRKAAVVVAIDIDEQRLKFAREKLGVEIINSKDVDPVQAVNSLIPGGPNKVIDCVGFRFPQSLSHKIQRTLGLETDAPNIVNAAIKMCRKNGKIALIGDYIGYVNNFFIGGFMEKHLSMAGGQLWPHRYYQKIFEAITNKEVDPSFIYTHAYPLSKIVDAYEKFDKHENGVIKVLVLPDTIYNKL